MADVLDAIVVAQPASGHLADAARLLEQAMKAGCQDPQVAYMLGLCCKSLGKSADARNAFRKIAEPDANVFLQMGLLSVQDNALAQAELEFAKAWELDPAGYQAAYNLLITRLSLGQTGACLELIPRILPLATPNEQHFLSCLEALLAALP